MSLFPKMPLPGGASATEVPPPNPKLADDGALGDRLASVSFRYTPSVPMLAGPICAENKRLEIWLIQPVGLPGATQSDHPDEAVLLARWASIVKEVAATVGNPPIGH